jgi:NADH-quinone oxidoreductase subunit G
MEGIQSDLPGALIPFFWAPGWNSVQSTNKYQKKIGGALRGGNPGVRLIEPNAEATPSFFDQIPSAFNAKEGEWLVVPLYHIFGSEELSARGKAVSELVPAPYIALSNADIERMKLEDGDEVMLSIGATQYSLPIKPRHGLPVGVVGMPLGLHGMSTVELPTWGKIDKA